MINTRERERTSVVYGSTTLDRPQTSVQTTEYSGQNTVRERSRDSVSQPDVLPTDREERIQSTPYGSPASDYLPRRNEECRGNESLQSWGLHAADTAS